MSGDLKSVLSFCEKHKAGFLEDLKKLVRIPSISFPGFPEKEVKNSAEAVAALFKESGLENIEIIQMPGAHPYVYADWLHAPGKPTLLLYAHHDVQPVGNIDLWKTPPFEPTEVNGRLYARGSADDKAGVVVHTSAVRSYLQTVGKLPLNVKFVIEGEEECGSSSLFSFLEKYKEKLKADAIVLTDTGNFDSGLPSITTSLRGVLFFNITVSSMQGTVHSGMWGGIAPDPVMGLCKIFSSMVDTEGRVQIPGLWEQVKKRTPEEQALTAKLEIPDHEIRAQARLFADTKLCVGRDGTVRPFHQNWYEPSFSINAFEASSRKNAASVINGSCWARFGIRLVEGMDPALCQKQVIEYVKQMTPWGLKVDLEYVDGAPAWATEPKGPAFESAMRALEKGYGKKGIYIGTGGAIPFVEPFAKALGGVPALLIGVEDPYSNAHGENESLLISDFEKAILSSVYLYDDFANNCK
ncbi:MAG: M20/M25/M40 family metallo-hydrolase [Bacteriovoracia bacterium]